MSRRPHVAVVGLGPGPDNLVTVGTVAAIEATPPAARYLRTARHPSARVAGPATTFDELYESAATFEAVYDAIVDALVEAAADQGRVLYAVPGSPHVLERSVQLLARDDRVEVETFAALSFIDLAWPRLGVDPIDDGVRLVDGHRFAAEAAGVGAPLLVAHCHNQRVLSDIKLAYDDSAPAKATVLQRLGLPDEEVFDVAWEDLDRAVEPDHLTTIYIAAGAPTVAAETVRFVELVRRLRAECPWDREQTHASLTRHLLEESYETVDAINGLGGPAGYAHLEEELGDVLFQVVFHATLAAEAGEFVFTDVVRGIHDKLVARHPHVFGAATAATANDVMANWELAKRAEKGRDSVFDGIPSALPALLFAHEVQRKAASIGSAPVLASSSGSLEDADAIGDALFELVAAARAIGVDPENALRAATIAFRDSARAIE